MKPRWDATEIQLTKHAWLRFTEAQANRMRAQIAARFRSQLVIHHRTRPEIESHGDTDHKIRITVHIYNYAKLSAGLLARAKSEAARAFGRIGIVAELADCPRSAAELGQYPACGGARSPLLVVKILPRPMTVDWSESRLVLGAALSGNTSTFASHTYVFFDRVQRRAEIKNCDPAVLLGYAMAHEVGHLLLGPGGHSSQGIMRPAWSSDDLQRAQIGELNFTPAQAQKMGIQIRQRTQLVLQPN